MLVGNLWSQLATMQFNGSRACVAMHNGRMFLCASDVVPASTEGCEGTFLITELGSATCIHSVTR